MNLAVVTVSDSRSARGVAESSSKPTGEMAMRNAIEELLVALAPGLGNALLGLILVG